jgi:hypothetical protein
MHVPKNDQLTGGQPLCWSAIKRRLSGHYQLGLVSVGGITDETADTGSSKESRIVIADESRL